MCECQPNGMICNKKTEAERDLTIFVELWWSIVLRYVVRRTTNYSDAPSPPPPTVSPSRAFSEVSSSTGYFEDGCIPLTKLNFFGPFFLPRANKH